MRAMAAIYPEYIGPCSGEGANDSDLAAGGPRVTTIRARRERTMRDGHSRGSLEHWRRSRETKTASGRSLAAPI